ncbi:MAG: phage major capsid protein [Selenomonadaceae bacterium]|nr:phage major capsid protein [Selenomonadaceae bacterium]
MRKIDELKQAMAAKKAEIENLFEENKVEDAETAAKELQILNSEFRIAMTLEETKFDNFSKQEKTCATAPKDMAKLRTRAFNKLVLNPLRTFPEPLTDEEKRAYFNVTGSPGQPAQIEIINTKGGYLVPQEQMAQLQEFRKDFVALKDYVNVVSTNYTSGRWATYTQQDLEFQSFSEMTDIAESDVTFGEATYMIEDKGLILPISNQLIADANLDIISFMGRQLAEGAVKTENKAILTPLEKLITGDTATSIPEATTITSYKALNTALWKTLDGVYYNSAKIFTNQDGFLWLSNLDDAQNRPLFVPSVTDPNKYFYRGKEIVVVPNSTLPNKTITNENYAPFLIGDLRSYLTFFERQGVELATSSELFFKKYGLALRAVIRFGVVVTDSNAMTALKVKV